MVSGMENDLSLRRLLSINRIKSVPTVRRIKASRNQAENATIPPRMYVLGVAVEYLV